jgi:hypothetical protein
MEMLMEMGPNMGTETMLLECTIHGAGALKMLTDEMDRCEVDTLAVQ